MVTVNRKAVDKLQRILALANGTTFEGEASTAAKMADEFLRKNGLHLHIPAKTRFWMVATDTGHLVWRFQPFSDAEIRAVPGNRRWVGQAKWPQYVTFALSTGLLHVLPVSRFIHIHDKVGRIILLREGWDERVIGSFFSATPITAVAMTQRGVAGLLNIEQEPWQNNHQFLGWAGRDRVVSAKVLPPNATGICFVTEHGRASTINLTAIGKGPRRAVRLNPDDAVCDFRVVTDLNAPIRLNTPTERFDIIPKDFLQVFGSEGARIKPPTEDAKSWWFRAWDENSRKAPEFPRPLQRKFTAEGHRPLTSKELQVLRDNYEDMKLNQSVQIARLMVGSFKAEAVQACSDAVWWLFLLGNEPTEAEKGILSLTTHDPALFCAVVALCDVGQSLTPEALELLWEKLTGKVLPLKMATTVLQRIRG